MKLSLIFYLFVLSQAFPLAQEDTISLYNNDLRIIKTSPNEFKIVSEDEKLKLKQEGVNFIDVTNYYPIDAVVGQEVLASPRTRLKNLKDWFKRPKQVDDEPEAPIYNYPIKANYEKEVHFLFEGINKTRIEEKLTKFSSFWTRYYKSKSGFDSSNWLYKQLISISIHSDLIQIEKFHHKEWDQFSIIARFKGEIDDIVVVGAHQDSINLKDPLHGRSPGADDDGSGSMTILEAFQLLAEDKDFKPYNTLEFQWYSAEEVGLLGSQDIFNTYKSKDKKVVAMLQQDMTGYTKDTIEAGIEVHIALIQDFVSQPLNSFLKMLFDTYSDIPYHLMSCGYACSDHASARRNGYPSSFMMEAVPNSNAKADWGHSENDVIDQLDFNHMKDHAKLTIAYAYELSLARDLY
ncbi:unnamed protein product [Candida verbasci]|uniref:Peptide hydrolase n=1 Tax=Candida verbasci TaxID=1227364 RepID=A0A9W4XL75_9ASCO|nr:unnamed protein product [Candida verbasci]